jgi:hypothetical protein
MRRVRRIHGSGEEPASTLSYITYYVEEGLVSFLLDTAAIRHAVLSLSGMRSPSQSSLVWHVWI